MVTESGEDPGDSGKGHSARGLGARTTEGVQRIVEEAPRLNQIAAAEGVPAKTRQRVALGETLAAFSR